MAWLRLRAPLRRRPRPPEHPKAVLRGEDGTRVVIPFAPLDLDHGGLVPRSARADRVGRPPLLGWVGPDNSTLAGTLLIAAQDPQEPVDDVLRGLRHLARSGQRVTLDYGRTEPGWYRLVEFTYTVTGRQHGTNRITRADARFGLEKAADVKVRVGAVSGGAKAPKPKPTPAKGAKGATRRHTVASGETLSGIAQRYYGSPARWREIAAANGVRDPRRLQIGQVLTIPA